MNKSNIQSEDWKDIVTRLRDIAEDRGITQYEIASRTGMIQSNISRIFSLSFIPKLSTIVMIAKAIGVELEVKEPKAK